MRIWRVLNGWRWYARVPTKLLVFLVVSGLVLYPKVWLVPTLLERARDLNSLLDPTDARLAPLEEAVQEVLAEAGQGGNALKAVQRVVCQRIPYGWDWDVWGNAEYLPTLAEVFERGREDCDGRAVVAASLLRRMGYQAWLVTDLLHMWVQTPAGETMSPSDGEKTLVGQEGGTAAKVSVGLVDNVARGLSYGVAVFPLRRELIIAAALCALLIQPRSSFRRRVAGSLLLVLALYLLRSGGQEAALSGRGGAVVQAWLGVLVVAVAWATLVIRAGGRHSHSGPPESPPDCEAGPD